MRTDIDRLDATIERFKHNAEYQRTHGDLHGCLEFKQLAEWLDSYKKILETSKGEPEPIRINLNEIIKVKLTDLGKDIYYHQFDDLTERFGTKYEPSPLKEDEDGYAKFQLWCFIELYGPHIGMIKPNVVEPLEIIYDAGAEMSLPKETRQKKGKWKKYLKEGLKWKCSICGSRFDTPWRFCPNCGCQMEGEE